MAIYDLLVSGKGSNRDIQYNDQWKRYQKLVHKILLRKLQTNTNTLKTGSELIKVFPKMRCAHYIWYLRSYWRSRWCWNEGYHFIACRWPILKHCQWGLRENEVLRVITYFITRWFVWCSLPVFSVFVFVCNFLSSILWTSFWYLFPTGSPVRT
jgi:hypothetical protein